MKKKDFYMVGNTHIDPVWLWNRGEGMQEVKSSFASALERMNEFPDFKFTQSSIAFLEWIKDNTPELFEQIQQRVAEGRWNIVGGTWIEPDCDITSGEGFIRQMLYGNRFVEDNFDVNITTAYNPDSFGHGANLPAVFASCGIKYYLMSRPDRASVELPPVFRWKSMDGSTLIAERTGGEYMAWTRRALEFNLKESLKALKDYNYDKMAVFYGVGNHGGGPTIENIHMIYEMIDEYKEQGMDMKFATIEEFFQHVDSSKLPERMQEMGRIYYGCYSSDHAVKQGNRKAEWTLLKAESLACLADNIGVSTYQYPKVQLEKSWKKVMFNQFHDILAGTSIESSSREACLELSGAVIDGIDIIRAAMQGIANNIDTRGEGFPLIVFNPTSVPYKGLFEAYIYVPRAEKKSLRIRDYKGKEIEYAETSYENSSPENRKGILFPVEVPAYGFSIYRVIHEGPDIELSTEKMIVQDNFMSNGTLEVSFDAKFGTPASITLAGKEILSAPSAINVYYDDRGAWGETVYQEKKLGSFTVVDSEILEQNHLRAVLRYRLSYEQSEMVIDYILEKDSARLKMKISYLNAERHRQISFDVPVAAKKPIVWSETGFLAEEKVDVADRNTEHYQHRFADVHDDNGQGLAIINDSTYGFRQMENVYKCILLRSAVYARGGAGSLPETLDQRFMDQGLNIYEFIWIPHAEEITKKRLFDEADLLHMPLEYLADSNHIGTSFKKSDTLLQSNLDTVKISAIKMAEAQEDTIVVRLFETAGKQSKAQLSISGWEIEVPMSPYSIKTILVNKKGWKISNSIEHPDEERKE